MKWGVVAGHAVFVVRVILAVPLRAIAWPFVCVAASAAWLARVLAWFADLVEGSPA